MKYRSAASGPMLGLRQADIHLEQGHRRTGNTHTSQRKADDNIRDSAALSFNHTGNNEEPRLEPLGISVCVYVCAHGCIVACPFVSTSHSEKAQSNLPLKTVLIIPMMITAIMIVLLSAQSLLSVAYKEMWRTLQSMSSFFPTEG